MKEITNTEVRNISTKIPDTPNYFIKISKEVLLENSLSEHRLSILLYLNHNRSYIGNNILYSPIYMIKWCGYSPVWHRGKNTKETIYSKFKDCMRWYFENGYILNFDESKFIGQNFQSSVLNEDKLLPNGNYGILYDFEIETINSFYSDYRPLNRSILLLTLSYIRAYTWVRMNMLSGYSEKSKKNKPEIFYSQFKTMGECIGVPPVLVSKAVDALEQLGLIKTHRMSCYQNADGEWRTGDIIFVSPYKFKAYKNKIYKCSSEEYDSERELKYGIAYLIEKKYEDKKFYQE